MIETKKIGRTEIIQWYGLLILTASFVFALAESESGPDALSIGTVWAFCFFVILLLNSLWRKIKGAEE